MDNNVAQGVELAADKRAWLRITVEDDGVTGRSVAPMPHILM